MFGFLLRLARAVLEGILSQLNQQLNIVQEQAFNPLKAIVQAVMGGVWIGRGADAFVEEVSNLAIPGVSQVADHITTMRNNLSNARDIIERADEEVDRLVQSRLFDAFEFY
jgi:uncharacterized protein YukE